YYPFATARNNVLDAVRAALPNNAITTPENEFVYFDRPLADRLAEWCSYKTSLIVPLKRDLSSRIFNVLLTGQIPLMPRDVPDLDRVIPPELQARLPILRFGDTVDSVVSAHDAALEAFDRDGLEGGLRRHRFA